MGTIRTKEQQELIQIESKLPIELSPVVMFTLEDQHEKETPVIEYYSSLSVGIRVTAYVMRFIAKCRAKRRNLSEPKNENLINNWPMIPATAVGTTVGISPADRLSWPLIPLDMVETTTESREPDSWITVPLLSTDERDRALKFWILKYQKQEFATEYAALCKGHMISRANPLWQLSPALDNFGIMRVQGRLNNAGYLTLDQKNPMILGRKNPVAKGLAYEAHLETRHGGIQLCVQYLRHRFWIIHGRILVRQINNACVICRRFGKRGARQFMADLPEVRTAPAKAFYNCGVDFAGPIQLRQGRNTIIPGFVAVFVCMVYKTIHLELVSNLTAQAFIAALDRFVAIRAGSIGHIYSDNGKNFVGTDRLLKEALKSWNTEEIAQHLNLQGIQWHFSPPRAPHFGGLWEAAVKSTKYHLKRVGGAHTFTYEELATLLAKITMVLNSRPLTPLTEDATDLVALTPGHFITGGQMLAPVAPQYGHIPINRLKTWQRIQHLQEEFWARFQKEYVTELNKRNKWAHRSKNLKVNDMVFIKDENTPPARWLLGRIIETYPDQNGCVRSARVRTQHSTFIRPIVKLCLIPLEQDLPKKAPIMKSNNGHNATRTGQDEIMDNSQTQLSEIENNSGA